jgi:hypothetical protein
MIKQENGQYCLYTQDGSKKLGCFDTEEEAKKREREVQFFKHQESGWLTLEAVKKLCPKCAQEMTRRNIRKINVSTLLESKRFQEQGFSQGLCASIGSDPGFFTSCVDTMAGKVSDANRFCAALHKYCTGEYPAEHESFHAKEDEAATLKAMMEAGSPAEAKKICMDYYSDNENADSICAALMEKVSAESAAQESVHFDAHMLESTDQGKTWEVVLIEAGVSKNGVNYSEELLKKSVPLFENVKAFAYEFKGDMGALLDHLPDNVRNQLPRGAAKNLVGDYSNARFGEFTRPDGSIGKGIIAKFHVAASWLRDLASNAWKAGRRNLFGFSIDALADVQDKIVEGYGKVRDVLRFQKLDEVTVVTSPGAGGVLLNLVESDRKRLKESKHMEQIWKYLKENFPAYLDGISIDEAKISESADVILGVLAKVQADLKTKESASGKTNGKQEVTAADVQKMVNDAIGRYDVTKIVTDTLTATENQRKQESDARKASRDLLERKVKESNLPEAEQLEVIELYGTQNLDEAGINRVIARKQAKLDQLAGAGAYYPNQTRESAVKVTQDQEDKWGYAVEGMLIGKMVNNVRPFHSLHESYTKITGRHGNPGQMGAWIMNELAHATPPPMALYLKESYQEVLDDHRAHLRESRLSLGVRVQEDNLATTSWTEILGANLYKAMLKAYENQDFSDWRKIVSNIASVPNFQTQRRQRMGGFADLATVSELGTYQEFTWPGDEEVTYSVSKYGNLAPLSMEALVNDDLGALRQIPQRIGLASARTLYKFVFDFIRTNPTMDYDSVALFASAHGNSGSTALADAALDDRIFAMADQTELSSGEVLMNLRPKYILFPNELERTAWEVISATVSSTNARTETVDNWYTTFGLIPIRVPYWSDATDWALVADPTIWDTIEIAFLQGRQEPEIFIQDAPTIGSVFTADKITYKVRFIFGGDVLDHRAFDKSTVAG